MSIQTEQGNEIVTLPGFWSIMFKAAVMMAPIAATVLCSILAWIVNSVIDHDRRLVLIEYQVKNPRAEMHQPAKQQLLSSAKP